MREKRRGREEEKRSDEKSRSDLSREISLWALVRFARCGQWHAQLVCFAGKEERRREKRRGREEEGRGNEKIEK